jgi:hypothetical protein
MGNHELPAPEKITPTTPLRLRVAAALAFPDGSMTEKALRELGHAGRLTVEKIRGKDYTTLADIEEMRKLCRVRAKAHDSAHTNAEADRQCGSSATDSGTSAQAALSAKVKKATEAAQRLKRGLSNTSQRNMTPKQAGEVISLKPQ